MLTKDTVKENHYDFIKHVLSIEELSVDEGFYDLLELNHEWIISDLRFLDIKLKSVSLSATLQFFRDEDTGLLSTSFYCASSDLQEKEVFLSLEDNFPCFRFFEERKKSAFYNKKIQIGGTRAKNVYFFNKFFDIDYDFFIVSVLFAILFKKNFEDNQINIDDFFFVYSNVKELSNSTQMKDLLEYEFSNPFFQNLLSLFYFDEKGRLTKESKELIELNYLY